MDVLSDVLQAVRLTGAIFFDIHATEPWVAETPAGSSIVHRLFPGADHLIPYHVVSRGACWGSLLDDEPMHLAAHEVIVFPHGDAHVISSAPGLRSAPDMALYRRPDEGQLPFGIRLGEPADAATRIVCGYLACDAYPFNPLLSALPRVIRIAADRTIGTLVELAVAESNGRRVGSETMLSRLSELLFVEMLRTYLETMPRDRTGWLAGLRDGSIGRALAALHQSPARDWTLDTLAHESGVSRSVLAERFTQMVGQPPMQYLASWRMQLAASDLRHSTDSIAVIAARVGYESEAAFSRAFKKLVGMPPSRLRGR